MNRNIVTDLRREATAQVVRLTSGAQMIQFQDDTNETGGGQVGSVTPEGDIQFTALFDIDEFDESEFA